MILFFKQELTNSFGSSPKHGRSQATSMSSLMISLSHSDQMAEVETRSK
jgi:hypothetical protein